MQPTKKPSQQPRPNKEPSSPLASSQPTNSEGWRAIYEGKDMSLSEWADRAASNIREKMAAWEREEKLQAIKKAAQEAAKREGIDLSDKGMGLKPPSLLNQE